MRRELPLLSHRPRKTQRGLCLDWAARRNATHRCRRITQNGDTYGFNYGASYLCRDGAIPVYNPALPPRHSLIEPVAGLTMASCIRDSSPDAWSRRVIINRLMSASAETRDITRLTYLLESGSDRIGALDFQHSATEYVPPPQSRSAP